MLDTHLTTGDVARMLGVPVWVVRRRSSSLGDLPRVASGLRLIPRDRLPELERIIRATYRGVTA